MFMRRVFFFWIIQLCMVGVLWAWFGLAGRLTGHTGHGHWEVNMTEVMGGRLLDG